MSVVTPYFYNGSGGVEMFSNILKHQTCRELKQHEEQQKLRDSELNQNVDKIRHSEKSNHSEQNRHSEI